MSLYKLSFNFYQRRTKGANSYFSWASDKIKQFVQSLPFSLARASCELFLFWPAPDWTVIILGNRPLGELIHLCLMDISCCLDSTVFSFLVYCLIFLGEKKGTGGKFLKYAGIKMALFYSYIWFIILVKLW